MHSLEVLQGVDLVAPKSEACRFMHPPCEPRNFPAEELLLMKTGPVDDQGQQGRMARSPVGHMGMGRVRELPRPNLRLVNAPRSCSKSH